MIHLPLKGLIKGIASNPQYFDIYVPPNRIKSFEIPTYNNCFAYVFEGNAKFDYSSKPKGIKIEKTINNEEYTIRDMSGNKTLITFDGSRMPTGLFCFSGSITVKGSSIKEFLMNKQYRLQDFYHIYYST